MKIRVSQYAKNNGIYYKNIPHNFEMEFINNIIILVGENNVGKSNILNAIKNHNSERENNYFEKQHILLETAFNSDGESIDKRENTNKNYFEIVKDNGEKVVFKNDQISLVSTENNSNEIEAIKESLLWFILDVASENVNDDMTKIVTELERIWTLPELEKIKTIADIFDDWLNCSGIDSKYKITYTIKNEWIERAMKHVEKYGLFEPFYFHTDDLMDLKFSVLSSGAKKSIYNSIFLEPPIDDSKRLYILDEIESFLHPLAIRKICSTIKDIIEKKKNSYFVIATHSPIVCTELADKFESIYKISTGGNSVDNTINISEKININKLVKAELNILNEIKIGLKRNKIKSKTLLSRFNEYLKIVNEVSIIERIRDWLNLTNCNILFANNLLLVEGQTERTIFSLPAPSKILNDKNIELSVLNGNFNLVMVLLLTKIFDIKNVYVILDDDLKFFGHKEIKLKCSNGTQIIEYEILSNENSLSSILHKYIEANKSQFTNFNINMQLLSGNIEFELLGDEARFLNRNWKSIQLMKYHNKSENLEFVNKDGKVVNLKISFNDEDVINVLKKFEQLN